MLGFVRHLSWVLLFCAPFTVFAQEAGNPFESIAREDIWTAGDPADNQISLPIDSAAAPTQITDHSADSNTDVTIGAVNISSDIDIAAATLAEGYEQYIGQTASRATLQELASAVSDTARDQGYIFASAEIPAQAVTLGVVTVKLNPGAIDEVRIIGSDNQRVRKILDRLIGRAARSEDVERQLLLVSDVPGLTLEQTNYQREYGKGILIVRVNEKSAKGYAALDNYGPETLGPIRARLELDIAGLLTDGDVFSANVISTVAQPSELTYVNLRYATILGDGATVIGVAGAAGRTNSGGSMRSLDLEGRSRYAAIFASHALKRSNDLNLWLNAELAYLNVEQTQDNVLFQDDNIITAAINFTGNYNIGIGRVYGGIGVTQGLGILGASRVGDFLNSRVNGSGKFTKANLWINSIVNMGGGFGMRLAGNAQIASRPLLSPNEIAIGGPYYGKGYDFSERFGDEGVLGLAELRKEFKNIAGWLDWLQLYGFVDGGHISNIGTGFGDGSLMSAGGGLRAQLGKFDLGVEAAAPVNEDRFESGDRSPRVNVQVGIRF